MPSVIIEETEAQRSKATGERPYQDSPRTSSSRFCSRPVVHYHSWNPRAVGSSAFWLRFRYASMWNQAPSCPEVICALRGKCRGMFVNT